MRAAMKDDTARQTRAAKSTDLTPYVHEVWLAKGLEQKRAKAFLITPHMTAGKRDVFESNITNAKNGWAIDQIVTNTMLSGEGNNVLK